MRRSEWFSVRENIGVQNLPRHESVQTSHWCFVARKVVKLIKQGKANDGLRAGASLALNHLWFGVNHLLVSIARSVVVKKVCVG